MLGEYAKTDITVEAGKDIDLGKLDWKPVRNGKQVWEIGYPNRNGGEFFKGDEYWRWGWYMRYALLFPNDLVYTVGKSDWHKDWFFEEVPHATNLGFVNPAAKDPANQPFRLGQSPRPRRPGYVADHGAAAARPPGPSNSTWNRPPKARHTPRLIGRLRQRRRTRRGRQRPVRRHIHYISTNALRYNTDRGVWREYSQPFNATLLKAGENEMTLTVPAGELTTGVCYDYLRLELDEK